jgi:hypothetical protein
MKTFKISFIFITVTILLMFSFTILPSQERDAYEIGREIMDRVQEQPSPKLLETETSMKIVRTYGNNDQNIKEEVKIFKSYSKEYSEEHNRTLIEFIRPSSIKVLRWSYENGDDEVWVKASSGSPKKLNSSGDKQDNFQGAHFTYEDMEERNLDDYEFKYMGKEKISIPRKDKEPIELDTFKVAARKLEGEDTAYSYAFFYVMPKTYIVMRADLYDKDKKFYKQMDVLRFESMKGYEDNYNIITHMRMRLVGRDNQFTEIKMDNIKVDAQAEANIYDSIFNSENL